MNHINGSIDDSSSGEFTLFSEVISIELLPFFFLWNSGSAICQFVVNLFQSYGKIK